MGLREEKKARTRKAISDLATCLFMERGYHAVTTAEIAARAEVSVATLFNYFPVKEALVFDEDEEMEAAMVEAIVSRRPGQSILEALRAFILDGPFFRVFHPCPEPGYDRFMTMIRATPELTAYARDMWVRYEKALAAAIQVAADGGVGEGEATATAHFVLGAIHFAHQSPRPAEALNAAFDVLTAGTNAWDVSWITRYSPA